MIKCHLIILHVLYKQLSSPFNNMYIICIYTYKIVELTLVLLLFFFFICMTILLLIVDTAKHLVLLEDSIREVLENLLQVYVSTYGS
jgi:hypothetical protein